MPSGYQLSLSLYTYLRDTTLAPHRAIEGSDPNARCAVLVPHVLEVKRLRKLANRKKRAETPASTHEQKTTQ
jgi:hypothetical protein